MSAGGDEHRLVAGELAAWVTEVGGGLRSLEHRGRPLVRPYAAGEVRPRFRGSLLAPWPNRVADGRYRFGGVDHQLPLNEPERSTALHGLVCWERFAVERVDDATVVATHALVPRPGYPYRLVVTATYAVGEDGLVTTVTARNAGGTPLPWGIGAHPYLVAGDGRGPVDRWHLEAPTARVLDVDPERLLPADPPVTTPVPDHLDFTHGRVVGGTSLDHAFTGLGADDGPARVRLVDPATGTGAELTWDPADLPWLQLHTADVPPPETTRSGLAVEPMTCPPDSFRSGVDLVVIEPGQEHTVAWTIAPVVE